MLRDTLIKLAVAAVMLATMIAGCMTSGCTPAGRQLGAEVGGAAGDLACVLAAQCSGITAAAELADFCRTTVDAVERYITTQADGPNCPLPADGGARE